MKNFFLGVLLVFLGAISARAQAPLCPAQRTVVDIPGGYDAKTTQCLKNLLISSVQSPNTIVRMGPNVVFDFTDVKALPIEIGRCTTLTSVASFGPIAIHNACLPLVFALPRAAAPASHLRTVLSAKRGVPAERFAVTPPPLFPIPTASARSTHSLGPVLFYGKHPDLPSSTAFFQAGCTGGLSNDGVSLSGFRLFGPSFGDQTTDETGLRIEGCPNVEVSNMEIAGWGGAGIENRNLNFTDIPPTKPSPVMVLIHDSYFHDNRHPNDSGHAEGYGVTTNQGGWSRVYNNLFDWNRHDIAANALAGGYDAVDNLLLKGGGFHGEWYETWTHVVDAHGTGCWWSKDLCGEAGRDFLIRGNVIQYTRNNDIHIRGKPRGEAVIDSNYFARSDKDAAVDLYTTDNVDLSANNHYNVDDYGQYGVCDLDGDGFDDLFFPTRATWWISGRAQFPWTFLSADQLTMQSLRLGYFDGSGQCDVAAELPSGSGQWFISKGGVTDPFQTHLVNLGHPASEVVFGRFDPTIRDHRPGVTRQTTHAFWRRSDGQWFVTPLSQVNWQPVQSSSFPLSKLRFGDFTGNGGTDVLAVENGHWAISEGARKPWRQLNATLSDPVETLYIANMDADDNIDDILKLETDYSVVLVNRLPYTVAKITWWRSKNGVEPWKVWSTYSYQYPAGDDGYVPVHAFVGRFGRVAGQGATLLIDPTRTGQFAAQGGTTKWLSEFKY